MKLKNLVIYILSLIMIMSLFSPLATIGVFAEETTDTETEEGEEATEEEETFDYLGEPFDSAQAKLETMLLYFENDEYAIYGLEETGEVGILVKATGQIMLTNPYDVATSKSSDAVKAQLLSQIILSYSDSTGTIVSLNSFSDAAFASEESKQITMSTTRTGLRVEYTIGREAVKYIVPWQIEKNAFEQNILGYLEEGSREYDKLLAYYTLKDINQPGQSAATIDSTKTKWPITEKYAIYVLDSGVGNRELLELEGYIKNTYYDDYSKVEEMYEMLNYVDTSAAPALFRFAIEYNLDDLGLEIRLPASSIRYDSSNYTLESVKFLPYFCAGSNENAGFTFIPDGSGTITRFEDIASRSFTLTGKLYGRDYSFHSITGSTQETMRLPAFGVMETKPVVADEDEETEQVVDNTPIEEIEDTTGEVSETDTEQSTDTAQAETETETETGDAATALETAETSETDETDEISETSETAESVTDDVNSDDEADDVADSEQTDEAADESVDETVDETIPDEQSAPIDENDQEEVETVTAGYVAYLVEGDAMAEITADHGGTVHKYSSVYTTFYPKPTDSYVLEGISTTGSAVWTVQSDRRYTGNYTLRIFPITGDGADYNDMAAEIRDYLIETGTFEKMTAENDKSDDVSLYLETFGTIKTTEKFIGFPVEMQTPLTTFEQTREMLEELAQSGVENINVRLTGWYNGGMEHTAPAKLKVEKSIGGKDGFKELAEYAEENSVSLYPDLDFVYVDTLDWFDGFDYKDDSVKTIDDRSAAYRRYSPLYQGFEEEGSLIISPTSMRKFYEDIKDDLLELGAQGLSVGTLGSELSSDHNEDYALNREDVKTIVSNTLSEMESDNESLMVSGGNAYTLPYVDHILNVPLDSSLNINTSESIPFLGMVLHGNVEFSGSAINLDGDYDYSVLKAIENGANLYFILSKDNTSELKQFEQFSKYYAIGYDIWKEDLINTYNSFNQAMKQVKYSYIVDHETLDTRIVKVVYENGVGFLLNYNTHDVQVGTLSVPAMSYVQFDAADEELLMAEEETTQIAE